MRVTPISHNEASTAGCWAKGEYDYEVKDAEETTSTAGNDMVKLEVWLYNTSGARRMVFDYLVSTDSMAYKIRHFAESCGLLPEYEKGLLMANEMVGRAGRCKVDIQPEKDGYPAKNVIRDYIKALGTTPRKPVLASAGTDLDDEIPF